MQLTTAARRSVWVVDDEPEIRKLIRVMVDLSDLDAVVSLEAENGSDALRKFRERTPEQSPTLVVVDLRMPKMSGLELARRLLREDPTLAIVLWSTILDDAIRAAAEEIGIAQCIAKLDVDGLAEVLDGLSGPLFIA